MRLRDRKKASTEEKDRNDCILASNVLFKLCFLEEENQIFKS